MADNPRLPPEELLPEFPANDPDRASEDRPEFTPRAVAHYLSQAANVVHWLFIDKLRRSGDERSPAGRGSAFFEDNKKTKPRSYVFLEQSLRKYAKLAYESEDFGATCRGNIGGLIHNMKAALVVLDYIRQRPDLYDETFSAERLEAITHGLHASLVNMGKAAGVENGMPKTIRVPQQPMFVGITQGITQILCDAQTPPEVKKSLFEAGENAGRYFFGGVREAQKALTAAQRIAPPSAQVDEPGR